MKDLYSGPVNKGLESRIRDQRPETENQERKDRNQ